MSELSVPLQSKRRARALLAQKVQHAVPSLVLFGDGLQRVGREFDPWNLGLGIAEVVTSVLVIVSVARAFRGVRASTAGHRAAHAVDWVDVFLAGMLVVEAFVHKSETGHLPRPTILLAATMFLLGALHGRIAVAARRRRSLEVTADGLSVPLRFLRRFRAAWRDIVTFDVPVAARAGVAAPAGTIRIATRDGRVMRLRAADIANADEVLPAMAEAQERYEAWREAARAKESTTDAPTDRPAHGDPGRGQPAKAD